MTFTETKTVTALLHIAGVVLSNKFISFHIHEQGKLLIINIIFNPIRINVLSAYFTQNWKGI